jgi:hypothetical protein
LNILFDDHFEVKLRRNVDREGFSRGYIS